MRRLFLSMLLVTVILAGLWMLYHKDQIQSPADVVRLATVQMNQLQSGNTHTIPWRQEKQVIRVASFDVNQLGASHLQDARLIRTIAEVIRQFDVVAIQNMATEDTLLLKRFLKIVNETGSLYHSAIRYQAGGVTQSAFLYDSNTIVLENQRAYAVNDPDAVFSHTPLVGWFRSKQADASKAFTFSLVNVNLDHSKLESELAALGSLYRAVRNDGRGEDDIIVLGNFWANNEQLEALANREGLDWVLRNQPTNTAGTHQLANLVLDLLATGEFTGETGVFDFMKHFNMTLQEAMRVSHYLPVWAEFSVYEELQVPLITQREPPTNAHTW